MRKWNAILTALILTLLLVHGILGGFQLLGIGDTAAKAAAWAAFALTLVHAGISVKYTLDTLTVQKRTGVSYFRENALFWARRLSGFAVLLLLMFHLTAFGRTTEGVYRLQWFDTAKLISQVLLVLAVGVHVIANVKPAMISFGIRSWRARTGEMLFVVSVLLLFMAAALVVYYLRWNVW